jgi:hypothetical protein
LISSVDEGETTNWKSISDFAEPLEQVAWAFVILSAFSSLESAGSWNILHFKLPPK